jgi:DNA-binding Lrp family transcriptional regulator
VTLADFEYLYRLTEKPEPLGPLTSPELVNEISRIGPDIPEIARRLGRKPQSVRYLYKKLQNRFAIQGVLNHECVGLRRIILQLKFRDEYADYVKPLMFAMNELSYVVSYSKIVGDDSYIVHASVPKEYVDEFLAFIESLRKMTILTDVESYTFDWFCNIPMRADYFDFAFGRWNFDMSSLPPSQFESDLQNLHLETLHFDRIDLLIAKELQIDGTRKLKEIQEAIKERDGLDIEYKTLGWHLKAHVNRKRMFKGYRINWMGTASDPVTGRVGLRRHAYTAAELLVRGPSDRERRILREHFSRLPVLWSEASGKDYYAQIAIPNEMIVEGLQFISEVMHPIMSKSKFSLIDPKIAVGFTFSYNLFNEETHEWVFNGEELLTKFVALKAEIGYPRP